MAAPFRIFISAGEASGDLYGSLLIAALRQQVGGVEFFGCGGDRMREAGCETLVDARQVAMVGLVEVLPGLPRAWQALRRLVAELRHRRAALAVLIDFPDFNLRLARELKQLDIPVLYFVAPQAWAWRRGRLKLLRRYVDRLFCIFPFEERFFRQARVPAEFVGHPLVGRVAPSLGPEQFRARYGWPEKLPLVALLPGSRPKEVRLNLAPMLEAARQLARKKEYGFVLVTPSPAAGEWMRARLEKERLPFRVAVNDTYNAVAHAALAIVASGTATIETALLGTPMVVVYRVSRLSWWLGRLLVRTPFYSMVNLVAGRQIVPELIQDDFRPEAVATQAQQLLDNSALREQMQERLKEVVEKLRSPESTAAFPPPGSLDPQPTAGVSAEKNPDAIQRFVAVAESMLKGEKVASASLG